MEFEDTTSLDDHTGGHRDPIALFTAAAADVGLIRPGDKLDQNLIDLCASVVDMAAAIGDRYKNPDVPEDTVGDVIRGELFT